MTLPLTPPLKPELALSRKALPIGEDYVYEVKLDGFRCIAFVYGEDVFLQSRNGRPLGRYFPELKFPPGQYVLDGEIVVRNAAGREDFDALGQRVHPAASRVQRLRSRDPRPSSSPSTCSPTRRTRGSRNPLPSVEPAWSDCSKRSCSPTPRSS